MDGKEDKQIYTPPAPSSEVYTDEELQAIVEGSTWVHLRAMAYELLQQRGVSRAQENWIESYKEERDEARALLAQTLYETRAAPKRFEAEYRGNPQEAVSGIEKLLIEVNHWKNATVYWTETASRRGKERDEAREWAIKLYQENRRLLSRGGELEVELEETRIERDRLAASPNVIIYGGTVQEILEKLSEGENDNTNP